MRALLPAVAEQLLKDIQKTFTETTRSEWSAVKNGCNVTFVSRQFYCRCSHGVEQQVDWHSVKTQLYPRGLTGLRFNVWPVGGAAVAEI